MLRAALGRGCRRVRLQTAPSSPSRTRAISRQLSGGAPLPQDFAFYPDFFTSQEQCVLLKAALKKLDAMESSRSRRRRRDYQRTATPANGTTGLVQAQFLPDDLYDFQEGHFDGVIKHYREMHVTSWPEDMPELPPLLHRLRQVHPDQDTQTHILHLASNGEILPHVDNLEASGSWILGVSLGDERVLRLENPSSPEECCELSLPSGSVYIQRDSVRYNYQHAILKKAAGGQRLSVMIRVSRNSESCLVVPPYGLIASLRIEPENIMKHIIYVRIRYLRFASNTPVCPSAVSNVQRDEYGKHIDGMRLGEDSRDGALWALLHVRFAGMHGALRRNYL
ncbi:hypothetical protein C8Q78DRAFT_969508 [Trametes maxima]|nr:hypothetical protein C8Q78DRAFT_969508 [Trametes maxima]